MLRNETTPQPVLMNPKSVKQSHWVTFLFILPFLVLLIVHESMGLTDAFMLVQDQRDFDSRSFNLVLYLSLKLGVCGFVLHASYIRFRSERSFYIKLVVLVVGTIAAVWLKNL